MKSPEQKELQKSKNQVYRNLHTLKERFLFWANLTLTDPDHVLYNQITELLNDVQSLENYEDLEAFIEKSKNIEIQLDSVLEKEGQNTRALNWPQTK